MTRKLKLTSITLFTLLMLSFSSSGWARKPMKAIYSAPQDTVIEICKTTHVWPRFKGGDDALLKFVSDHMQCPASVKEKKKMARVITEFTIEKDGSISDVTVARSVDPECDKEAARLVSIMPNWEPAYKMDPETREKTYLRYRYFLPIVFKP